MTINMNLQPIVRFNIMLFMLFMLLGCAGMSIAERTVDKWVLEKIGMEDFKDLLKKIAQLLEIAVNRFLGETNALWGISSVVVIIKELKDVIVSAKVDRFHLMEQFGSLITSLKKLCLNSGPSRAAFHSADGVDIVMEWLTEIIDGRLGWANPVSFDLFEILKSLLQDVNLNLSESGMIASRLEKLLVFLHSKWVFWKSSNSDGDNTNYIQLESMASLLNILEGDPRYDYEASAAVKEIMMKLQ